MAELEANRLVRHWSIVWEKSLQDYVAGKHKLQSTSSRPVCRLHGEARLGWSEQGRVQERLRKEDACMRLWWEQGVKTQEWLKVGKRRWEVPKKAPGNGYLIMQHILGNAEYREILLRVDFRRTQQACAGYRSKAWGCQLFIWGNSLADASKGVNQFMQSGLKAGKEAPLGHCGLGSPLPQAMQEDSLSFGHRRGGSPAVCSCGHHCPKISSLNTSKG